MTRCVGVTSRGIRTPIIKQGDDLAKIVCESVLTAAENENFQINDRDVIAITESVVARAQGNYATVDNIAQDIKSKLNSDEIGVIFPILSRNRFAIILKSIARAVKKIYLMLSYPSDEVGNHLFNEELLEEKNVNPYSDVLSLKQYRDIFGYQLHEFTGMDYVTLYGEICRKEGCEVEIIFANQAKTILNYTKHVICADIHTRHLNKQKLLKNGAKQVLTLDEILTEPVDGSGYNEQYGLLGTNLSKDEQVKLFPRKDDKLIKDIQDIIFNKTNKHVEVMVYGDGAFKDPQGKIWELADPVVSPFHSIGLMGTPNEIKLKYLADNNFENLKGNELISAIKNEIAQKSNDLVGKEASLGTTPRQITDLLGSLCDLTSGSGDKGTPVILVQGYFDNFANE